MPQGNTPNGERYFWYFDKKGILAFTVKSGRWHVDSYYESPELISLFENVLSNPKLVEEQQIATFDRAFDTPDESIIELLELCNKFKDSKDNLEKRVQMLRDL